MGSRFVFTGNTKLPNKIAEDFLITSANKNDFNKLLAKTFHHLYIGDKIYILSYCDSVLTNHPGQVSQEGLSIRKCQFEEADQRVIRNTLYLLANKSISRLLFQLLTLMFSFF